MNDAISLAQKESIKNFLLVNYVGGKKEIRAWDDFAFSLSHFFVHQYANHAGVGIPAARRVLKRLVTNGAITLRKPDYKGQMLRFRMDRQSCDVLATEARAELMREYLEDLA